MSLDNITDGITDASDIINSIDVMSTVPTVADVDSVVSNADVLDNPFADTSSNETDETNTDTPDTASGGGGQTDNKKEFVIKLYNDKMDTIAENGHAYISTDPAMPYLLAVVEYDVTKYKSVFVRLAVNFEKTIKNHQGQSYKRSTSTTFDGKLEWLANLKGLNLTTGVPYTFDYNNKIVGGDASVLVYTDAQMKKPAATFKFKISGTNPSWDDISAYIDSKSYDSEFWFFKAICKHESGNGQFKKNGTPIFGAPDGWGLMQVDTQYEASPDLTHLWNWKVNVDKAYDVLKAKKKIAVNYYKGIANKNKTKLSDGTITNGADTTEGNVTFIHAPTQMSGFDAINQYFGNSSTDSSHKSFIDATVIKLYNGNGSDNHYFYELNDKQWNIYDSATYSNSVNYYVKNVCNEYTP